MAKNNYAQCKASIYRWKQKNKEYVNKLNAMNHKKHYVSKLAYSFDHIVRQFMNIKTSYSNPIIF